MLDTLYSQIGAALVFAVCLLALWKGERTEQWGAGVYVVGFLGSILVQDEAGLVDPQFAVLAIDLIALAVFGTLAWKSERSWPVWATAFQAVGVAVHLAFAMDLRIGARAYIAALALSSYGVLAALAVGAFIVWREREALKY